MRKLLTAALCFLLFLSGCTVSTDVNQENGLAAYETYFRMIESNASFIEESSYYTVSTETVSMNDGSWRYYVVIDEPETAMYDVALLAVEDGYLYDTSLKMMPSLGIFDSFGCNLIPYQVNAEKGFMKGLVISGESDSEDINLKMMVEWKDKTGKNTMREFLSISLGSGV